MKRESGVLMHISSLHGEYGIGSFGKEAYEFVDLLADCGFSKWQVLPFCVTDECYSPYKSYSAFGTNPWFIDLEALKSQDLLTENDLEKAKQNSPYSCEYERLETERIKLLSKAAHRCGAEKRREIKSFIDKNPYIAQMCEFMALKSANGEKCWSEWTTHTYDEKVLFEWQFMQSEFFSQWKKLKDYANSRGIGIIGDIPFYVSFDSADVWGNSELFRLDSSLKPADVAGVPPDYFCEDGQLWGNPLYNWDAMKKDGYSWWMSRLENMFSLFDGVRIDHFRAIESYWAVPGDAETAKEGRWIKGPGKDFVDKVKEVFGNRLIIAEDLGMITEEVAELVSYSGFPGMRVMQFGFTDDSDTVHKPHNYVNNCVAYTGTHDNNTLLGYVWELDDSNRKSLMEYCGYLSPDWDKGYDSIIRTLFASNAGLVILPIQDILGYGSDTRLNTPGTSDNNWRFRVSAAQLGEINREKYKRLNFLYKR